MPYIKEEQRPPLDLAVDELANVLLEDNDNNDVLAGKINYSVFRLLMILTGHEPKNLNPPITGGGTFLGECNYARHQVAMGNVMEAVNEFRARYLRPYEDKVIENNGDV